MQTNTTVTQLTLQLPQWAIDKVQELPPVMPNVEQRMETVLFFAGANFKNDTGGPFAAAVFEEASGRLVSIGVNRVVPSNCSTAHAEIMALSLAQAQLQTYDLGGPGMPSHQLVVNWCPCAMCFGAVLWSGIRSLVIAGAGSQLEAITGFDEGPIHPQWRQELEKRGITLQEDVLHEQAVAQFEEFAASGRPVYNARLG
jgi:tRNA(Arg) A34 adenosine deaminase TadA